MSGQPETLPGSAQGRDVKSGLGSVRRKLDEQQVEYAEKNGPGVIDNDAMVVDGVHDAGMAIIEQVEVIPKTGRRIPTSRWEYITFTLYCESG